MEKHLKENIIIHQRRVAMQKKDTPIILKDLIQGSEEWVKLKLGVPSASNASKIITNNGKSSKQREGYMFKLASEIITGNKEEGYKNSYMEIGNEREAESRVYFEMCNGVDVEEVGVVYKDDRKEFLCSPDGIINREYGLELKNVLPKTQDKYLYYNVLPSEYFSQIQFSLYVTGYKYWIFQSYVPSMPELCIKVERDEEFLTRLEVELKSFCIELKEIVKKIK